MGDLAAKRKILIIDDEKDTCEALESVLSRAGYGVSCACSGQEALDKIKEDLFDLIFLDIYLPEMGGLEVFRHIKKIAPSAQVCIMTGWPEGFESQKDVYLTLLEEGALDMMLRKPFSKKEILDVSKKLLEG